MPSAIDRASQALGDPALAAWAFTQWSLRERGRAKFARSLEMLFDREGLEMATPEEVALWRAGLFPSGARVLDATVGIGADLVGLSSSMSAFGIEIDPERARLARHNLDVHGSAASVSVGDCLALDWDADFFFADPARRESGRRSVRISDARPDPLALLSRAKLLAGGAIKLSPMSSDEDLELLGGSRLFVSYRRECREALVLTGQLATGWPAVAAVFVEGGYVIGGGHDPVEALGWPLDWIYESNPAVVRAHAEGRAGLPALGDARGYLTGEAPVALPWVRRYRTLWSGPFKAARIKTALAELELGLAAVKTRGLKVDPSEVAASLRNHWPRRAVLIVYRSGKAVRAALAEPVSPD
jgi:hypothetical protein